MSEYDLVCDVCGKATEPGTAIVSWREDGDADASFALTHAGCVPETSPRRTEVSLLIAPSGYLRFVNERLGRASADAEQLRAIVSAVAPFVMRPDNPAEMDALRAASFGAKVGVKPGVDAATPHAKQVVEARGDVPPPQSAGGK